MSSNPSQWSGANLFIDLSAIADNYHLLQKKVAPSRCAAVVKANAYGLGVVPVAQRLEQEGCREFFVAHLEEGLALRPHLPDSCLIYVLHGLLPHSEAVFAHANLIPVLNSIEQIEAWVHLCKKDQSRYPAGIQLDTGMSRFGIGKDEYSNLSKIEWNSFSPVLVISHLACADTPEHPANTDQLKQFKKIKQLLPPIDSSLSASSGIFLGKDWHFDLVRPGAALYGINPTPTQSNPMKTVIRLLGKIIQIRSILPGDFVGYGATFVADKPMRLALVSVGYADGFFRILGNRAFAKIDQAPHTPLPIIGRISMDSLCVDITQLPTDIVKINDTVELLGPSCPIEQIANMGNTIGYELFTSLGNRYHRIYV